MKEKKSVRERGNAKKRRISRQVGQKWPLANLPGGANLDIFYFKIREFIICGFVY